MSQDKNLLSFRAEQKGDIVTPNLIKKYGDSVFSGCTLYHSDELYILYMKSGIDQYCVAGCEGIALGFIDKNTAHDFMKHDCGWDHPIEIKALPIGEIKICRPFMPSTSLTDSE